MLRLSKMAICMAIVLFFVWLPALYITEIFTLVEVVAIITGTIAAYLLVSWVDRGHDVRR